MAVIDPYLKYVSSIPPEDWQRLEAMSAVSVISVSPPVANIMLEIADDVDDLPDAVKALEFKPRTRAGRIFTGNCPLGAIHQLEGMAGLKRAEASRALRNELDIAVGEADGVAPLLKAAPGEEPPPGPTGCGVVVGIVDTGIDYTHQAFRHDDGSSRILAIWDQGMNRADGAAAFGCVDYGVEYVKAAIDAALVTPDPFACVPHRDRPPFHGTHVAGIVAGGRKPVIDGLGKERRFTGVAPDADLIVVANTRSQTSDPGTIGDSADTLDAIDYILRKAGDRPVVINLSLGDNIGPHDGTSLLEMAIGSLINGRGRVLVKSSGNEGNTRHHAEGDLIDGNHHDVRFSVPTGESEILIDVWFSGTPPFGVTILPPAGTLPPNAARPREFIAPSGKSFPLTAETEAFVDAQTSDPVNGHHHTFIALSLGQGGTTGVNDGVWTLRLTGIGRWHAWIQRNSDAGFEQSTNTMTASIPAASDALICVGSYVSDERFTSEARGQLSAFSSRGPTRDGRRVPSLVAPGQEVTSAQPGNRFAAQKGTSMAAAMVTGTVARMLELEPDSTCAEIRACLERTARKDEFTGKVPNNDWGAGKLDIKAACREIVRKKQTKKEKA